MQPARLRRIGHEGGYDAIQLSLGLSGRVALEDSRLRLDDLAERPERHALAVGQAPPLSPRDQPGLVVHEPEELEHEA